MCEQSRVFEDGEIVWVKLSNCWWPGEVHEEHRLPEDMRMDMQTTFKKRPPYAVVKFFQEDSYEYVRNVNNIHLYQCDRRLDFIKKGIEMFQANHKYMAMFPADVATAERLTNGNPDIVNDPTVLNPVKTASRKWSDMFPESTSGAGRNNSVVNKKGAASSSPMASKKRLPAVSNNTASVLSRSTAIMATALNSPKRVHKEHEVRILSPSTPSFVSGARISGDGETPQPMYNCHECSFTTTRLNVLILHSKSHTASETNSSSARGVTSLPQNTPKARTEVSSKKKSLVQQKPSPTVRQQASRRGRGATTTAGVSTRIRKRSEAKEDEDEDASEKDEEEEEEKVTKSKRVSNSLNSNKTATANKTRPPKKRTKRGAARSSPVPVPSLSPDRKDLSADEDEPLVKREPEPLAIADSKKQDVLKDELLKDWSEDEDQVVGAIMGGKNNIISSSNNNNNNNDKDATVAKVASAKESNDKRLEDHGEAAAGRSSPLRCRNIPKKDRRDFVFEEMDQVVKVGAMSPEQPKEQLVMQVATEPKVVASPPEADNGEPIVQKKKKAVERLQKQDSTNKVSLETKPPSCFDFDEAEEVVVPLVKEQPEELNAVVVTDSKDEELAQEIDSFLNETHSPAKEAKSAETVDDSGEATGTRPRTISLPPKERGKRIFKSRNRNEDGMEAADITTVPVSSYSPANGDHKNSTNADEVATVGTTAPVAIGTAAEATPSVLGNNEQKIVQVPRKRKYDQSTSVVLKVSESGGGVGDDRVPDIAAMVPALSTQTSPQNPPKVMIPGMQKVVIRSIDSKIAKRLKSIPAATTSTTSTKTSACAAIDTATGASTKSSSSSSASCNSNSGSNSNSSSSSTSVGVSGTTAAANEVLVAATETDLNGSHTWIQESPAKTVASGTKATTKKDDKGLAETVIVTAVDGHGSGSEESLPPDSQLLAIPGETFGGPANSFYLCTVDEGNFIPIDNQPLYLDESNQLVPASSLSPSAIAAAQAGTTVLEEGEEEVEAEEGEQQEHDVDGEEVLEQGHSPITRIMIGPDDQLVDLTDTEQKYILNTGNGQQILLDHQSLLTIASGGEAPRLVLPDGQEMIIEGTPQEILSSITIDPASSGDFEAGGYDGTDAVHHDLIATALASTDNRQLNAVSAAHVLETNAVLTQPPIMSALEVPSKATSKIDGEAMGAVPGKGVSRAGGDHSNGNLNDSLAAVIGIKNGNKAHQNIPASLELPITITDPTIAARTTQASIKTVYLTSGCNVEVGAAVSATTPVSHTDEMVTTEVWDEDGGEGEEQLTETVLVEEVEEDGEEEDDEGNIIVVMSNDDTDGVDESQESGSVVTESIIVEEGELDEDGIMTTVVNQEHCIIAENN